MAESSKAKFSAAEIARGAVIGALYAAITLAAWQFSSGLIQVRISEALCVLPYFTFSAVPGLFVGCLIANLVSGAAMYDVIFGSLATLAAAAITYLMRKKGVSKWLAPLPAVVINAFVVGALLVYVYDVGESYLVCAASVAAGQAVACYALGMPLLLALERFGNKLFREMN